MIHNEKSKKIWHTQINVSLRLEYDLKLTQLQNSGEAVDRIKQKHIYQSARYYIYKNEIKDIAIRLDIIEVYLYRNNNKVNHIKQAF